MDTPINPNSLNVTLPKNQTVPAEGPKAVPVRLDFTGATITGYELDATLLEQLRYLSMIQTIYIDMVNNPNSLVVTVENGGQVIQAKGNTQGYYPILVPNPMKLFFRSSANSQIIPVFLINIPIAGVIWSTQ